MKLHAIAHARAGDKGDISDVSVIAYADADYEFIRTHVTADRVKEHFADIHCGDVQRYEVPGMAALKFVLHDALQGGVTRSLNLDIHGKSLSSSLLELELPERRTGPEDSERQRDRPGFSSESRLVGVSNLASSTRPTPQRADSASTLGLDGVTEDR